MIEKLISEYLSNAEVATAVDVSDRKSVRKSNAAVDRMRAIVDEVVGLGQDAVREFASLLDKEPAGYWVAHHLVEKVDLDSATLSRCFSRVEKAKAEAEATTGKSAAAMGEGIWLREWRAKKGGT